MRNSSSDSASARLTRGIVLVAVAAAVLAVPTAVTPRAGARDGAVNTLAFTRADGTRIVFPARTRVWCGRWSSEVRVRALHVLVGVRRPGAPFWSLDVVLRDFRPGRTIRFPHDFVWNRPTGAVLFVLDPSNELSSAEENSRGYVVLRRASCKPGARIEFTVRAVLGSELHDARSVSVRGRFAAAGR